MVDADRAGLLLIGIGNSLRRDDGAGLLLATALAGAWRAAGRPVRLLTTHQLAPEHALEICRDDVSAVLFIDAAVDTTTPALRPVVAANATAPAGGHTLGPATVLLYARLLDTTERPACLLTIPAYDLDHGEGLSPATQAHLDRLLADAASLWQQVMTLTRLKPTD